MVFIYRTAGAWGAGKGANLTPTEVDLNFYQAEQRLAAVESDPSTPVGIAEITVTGTTMTIVLTNAEEFGPFELPIATIGWAGEWTPGEEYSVASLFTVSTGPDAGLYLVVQAYEAGTEFDPAVATTNGDVLIKVYAIPSAGQMSLLTVTEDYLLPASTAGYYIRVNSATAKTVTVQPNSAGGYLDGSVYTFRQAGAGEVSFVAGVGVTINTPETLTTRRQHSTVTLIKVGADEWDLTGDMDLDLTA